MSLRISLPMHKNEKFEEKLKKMLEEVIGASLAGNQALRGSPVISEASIGSIPPEVSLSQIVELTNSQVTFDINIHYEGDAGLALRGLSVNLDSGSINAIEEQTHVTPFFCPFEARISDIRLDSLFRVVIVSPHPISLLRIIQGTEIISGAIVHVQSFTNPLKDFSVTSNFDAIDSAQAMLRTQLHAAINPIIKKLMSEGFTFKI